MGDAARARPRDTDAANRGRRRGRGPGTRRSAPPLLSGGSRVRVTWSRPRRGGGWEVPGADLRQRGARPRRVRSVEVLGGYGARERAATGAGGGSPGQPGRGRMFSTTAGAPVGVLGGGWGRGRSAGVLRVWTLGLLGGLGGRGHGGSWGTWGVCGGAGRPARGCVRREPGVSRAAHSPGVPAWTGCQVMAAVRGTCATQGAGLWGSGLRHPVPPGVGG